MGLSNKIIFFSGYRKTKQFQVDTIIGKFNCTLLKEKCMNNFCIKAKQTSVKYGGTEYPIDKETYRLVLLPTYEDTQAEIKEFKTKHFKYNFLMRPHMHLLYSCVDFGDWLKDTINKSAKEIYNQMGIPWKFLISVGSLSVAKIIAMGREIKENEFEWIPTDNKRYSKIKNHKGYKREQLIGEFSDEEIEYLTRNYN